jgi:hypothetical protein
MKFSTPNGKLIHLMKYKLNNDLIYSTNNYKLVAYCGITCGENDAHNWADINGNPEIECLRCIKIKNDILGIAIGIAK